MLSLLVSTRRDKPWSGTRDGGTSELCEVFLLGQWLYVLTVWLAFCSSFLLTHWCFQSKTKFNRCGLKQFEWPLWNMRKNIKKQKLSCHLQVIILSSVMPLIINIERLLMYIIQIARVVCQHFSTSISVNIEYNSNQRIGGQAVWFGGLNNSDIYFKISLWIMFAHVFYWKMKGY